jgi:SsrA-binding protein
MTSQLLQEASQVIPNQQLLINVVSKRVRQLGLGHRPLVEATPRSSLTDIALREIIGGKLTFRADARDRSGGRFLAGRGKFDLKGRCQLPGAIMAADTILNRKALRDFHILERYEAGIELKGSEVKSIRAGKANIGDAFAKIEKGPGISPQRDIQPYAQASIEVPPAKRVRRLLLHRQEIDKLYGETAVAGRTLVILSIYWKKGS